METQGWTQWKEQIESLLEQGPQRAEPIAQALQVPQDEVLPVLEAMVEEGRLVKTRKDGKNVCYSLDDDHVKTVLEQGMNHIRHQKHYEH